MNIRRLLRKYIENHPYLHSLLWRYRDLRIDNSPLRNANDPVLVYRQDLSGVTALVQKNNGEHSAPLPKGIVMQPGRYHFCGGCYDCLIPGVYRFISPQHRNQQHVVLDVKDPVLSAILLSFLSVRGNNDDRKLNKELEQIAANRFLSLTCGQNCLFCQMILQNYGIKSRIVYSHTNDELNSYNNGHVLLEVYSLQYEKYILVDIDKKCTFIQNMNLLSLYEYGLAIHNKHSVDINFHSPVAMIDLSSFVEKSTVFNYCFIEYSFYSSEASLRECLSRICQIPIMMEHGKIFACAWDQEIEKKLSKINPAWAILDESDFQKRFYPSH